MKNNKYLISKDDFDKIEDKFESAKTILNKNLIFIRNKIDDFKSQLQKLEKLYKDYKDINDKLMALANFILDTYKNELNSRKSINYPNYFNVKNVLEFNFQEFNIKDDDLSIKSFENYIIDMIKSGSFFLLSDSKYNKNLNDYTNEKLKKINILNLDEFKEIKVEYSKIILLEDKTKLVGIKEGDNLLEIFNIEYKFVETAIKLDSNVSNFNIFLKDDILLLITDIEIYIFNSKTFSLIQKIKFNIEMSDSKKYYQFIYGEILSKDSIGIVYRGDLEYLIDFSLLHNYINLPLQEYNLFDIVNCVKKGDFDLFEQENYKYFYFLIYRKDNSNKFILEKIILLIKENIALNEVETFHYKYFTNEDTNPYCTFYFDSLNRFSETEFIISFKCEIKEERDQFNYYIIDENYSDEATYYYYLDINDDIIRRKICLTNNDSFLHKIDNTFYFLFNELGEYSFKLKGLLKDYKFIEIKMDEVNFRDFYYQNKFILGWNNKSIYLGNIFSNNELEIIKIINKSKINNIISINFNPNYMMIQDSKK